MLFAHQLVLKSPFVGKPYSSNFEIISTKIYQPELEEVLFQIKLISIDPYLRLKMNPNSKNVYDSYLNKKDVINGYAIAQVIDSSVSTYKIGSNYVGIFPFQEFLTVNPTGLNIRLINESEFPLSYYLGILGMPGFSAYVGMKLIKQTAENSIFISSAAGTVGSLAGQMAKRQGYTVYGSTRSPSKISHLKRLGFDKVFLANEFPNIDTDSLRFNILFENVGRSSINQLSKHLNKGGQIIISGLIEQYNEPSPGSAIDNFNFLTSRQIKVSTFLISNHAHLWDNYFKYITPLLKKNQIRYHENVISDFQYLPRALNDLLEGKYIGKLVIKLD